MNLEIDFTLTLSVIIALIALISPIITALINNHYQTKLKKIDMYEDAKRKALAEFIECAQDYLLNNKYVEQNVKYYASLHKLFIYFSNIDLTTFISFENACTKQDNYKVAIVELTKIVQSLSEQIAKE